MAINLFSANRRVNAVSWYENEGAADFTRRIADDDSIQVHTLLGVDLDGDIDLLSASRDAFEVALQTRAHQATVRLLIGKKIGQRT